MVYFDHSASTKPYPSVLRLCAELSEKCYFNPSSLYKPAYEAQKLMEEAGRILAEDLSCSPQQLIFTSSATESSNSAFAQLLRRSLGGKKIILCGEGDHAACLETAKAYRRFGFELRTYKLKQDGRADLDSLAPLLNEQTAFLSFLLVNNETGAISDWKDALALKRERAPRALFHLDAVQAWGKIPLRLKEEGLDFVSLSGHKIHAPKGVALLYISEPQRFDPLLYGGGQQRHLRSGTENPVLARALAEAVEERNRRGGIADRRKSVLRLRQLFLDGLAATPGLRFRINGASVEAEEQIPHILNLSFPGARSETLMNCLEAEEVYVSAGSACHASSKSKSHVLSAMNLPREILDSALRISFDADDREEDVHFLLEALVRSLRRLRVLRT